MEELTLETAAKELDKLSNDKNYWEYRLQQIVSLTMPHSPNLQNERVDGGIRIDKFLQASELEEEHRIKSTLKYINGKIYALNRWIEEELKRLDKYGDTEKEIVYLREHKKVRDKYTNRLRVMTWTEIAKETHYSERTVRYIYKNSISEREKNV